MRFRSMIVVLVVVFGGCLIVPAEVFAALEIEAFAKKFESPTGFAFAPNGDLYVIEKATGRVLRQRKEKRKTMLDLPVNSASERGLLGIALDPNFPSQPFVYLYYSRSTTQRDTQGTNAWRDNRVSRFRLKNGELVGERILLRIPSSNTEPNGPVHNGGPLRFGPDGMLYGVVGDLNRAGAEQNAAANTSSNSGGIFRIDRTGAVPADNPFALDVLPGFRKWFAYGVRNSFGLAFDPVTGGLWDTENGPDVFDEINKVAAGFNSGWSKIMGPDSRDPQGVGDLAMRPGASYSDPEFSFLNCIGITAICFLDGSSWIDAGGDFDDFVLVGDVNTGQLYLLELNPARDGFLSPAINLDDAVADTQAEADQLNFGSGFGIVTDIQLGPGGDVFVCTLAGTIYRIAPEP
jgi:glucose/arabinose dehydrogenase